MKYYKYETIYPRTLWIINMTEENPTVIENRFLFFKNLPGWEIIDNNVESELLEAKRTATAGCYPVQERSTGKLGVLLILFDMDDVNTNIIAHESVHLADFFYEACGMNAEDFTDGNEAYAYLVGWCAGCVANAITKEKQNERRKTE